MSSSIDKIREYHGTCSFGSRENLVAQTKKIEDVYRQLSEAEISELIDVAIRDSKLGDDYLVCLACLHPDSLKPHHQRLIDHEFFNSGLIYRDADQTVSSQFVSRIEGGGNRLSRNHLLLCMSWAGNEAVQSQFAEWLESPPDWAEELYVPPHSYANDAGWELSQEGIRRDLFYRTALPLVPAAEVEQPTSDVKVGFPSEHSCGWCNRSMPSLLKVNTTSKHLNFMQGQSPQIEVVTCDVCTAFGMVFGLCDETGSGTWHPKNVRPDYLPKAGDDWDTLPENPLVLAGSQRHFMEGACWTTVPGVRFSQVGGLPTWVQDAEYPDCVDCKSKMIFIGQISNEDFDLHMEGIYYAFHCSDCRTTATHYQQT